MKLKNVVFQNIFLNNYMASLIYLSTSTIYKEHNNVQIKNANFFNIFSNNICGILTESYSDINLD